MKLLKKNDLDKIIKKSFKKDVICLTFLGKYDILTFVGNGAFVMTLKKNAIVGQSGGPTSVINAALSGVIDKARTSGKINKLYGARYGIEGILNEDFISLFDTFSSKKSLSLLENTPSSALGSCRYRLSEDLCSSDYKKIFEIFDRYNIGYFFYIGGNDSMDTVTKLSLYCKEKGLDVSIIGVPKTIDNDLFLTDFAPGYPSACKYISTLIYELSLDIRAYNMPSVTIVETMGRDTGWLCCASALPKYLYGFGPDLIFLPEVPFCIHTFLERIKELLKEKRGILVCLSEGINLGEKTGDVDAFNHKRLSGCGKILEKAVKNTIGCKARSIEINLPQRCAFHLSSYLDLRVSRLCGELSVDLALEGLSGKMVSVLRRKSDSSFSFGYANASSVANRVRQVPSTFIGCDACPSKDYFEYIKPLVLGENKLDFYGGIPRYYNGW